MTVDKNVSLKEAGLRAGSRLKGLRVYAINGIHLCKRQLSSCVALFNFDFFFQYIFNFLSLSLRIKLPNQLWV